jgi:hypothetical protein
MAVIGLASQTIQGKRCFYMLKPELPGTTVESVKNLSIIILVWQKTMKLDTISMMVKLRRN